MATKELSPQDAFHARVKAKAEAARAARKAKRVTMRPPQTLISRGKTEKLAAQATAAAVAAGGGEPQGNAYELMLAQLAEHKRRLKDIESIERKIAAKREFVTAYFPWISGALHENAPVKDEILSTVMVWLIDVADMRGREDDEEAVAAANAEGEANFQRAWAIGQHMLHHNLPLPDEYRRSLPAVLQEDFSDAALAGKMTAQLALKMLPQIANATQEADVHDQVRAKLHKAMAYALLNKLGRGTSADIEFDLLPTPESSLEVRTETISQAHTHLLRALELNKDAGVKKDIERVERWLKNATPPA